MKKNNLSIIWLLGLLPLVMAVSTLTDPTRPAGWNAPANLTAQTTQPQSMVLQAVFVSEQGRMAIISGQRVMVGDNLGEYIVTAINLDTVDLMGPDKNKETLYLGPSITEKQ